MYSTAHSTLRCNVLYSTTQWKCITFVVQFTVQFYTMYSTVYSIVVQCMIQYSVYAGICSLSHHRKLHKLLSAVNPPTKTGDVIFTQRTNRLFRLVQWPLNTPLWWQHSTVVAALHFPMGYFQVHSVHSVQYTAQCIEVHFFILSSTVHYQSSNTIGLQNYT